MIKKSQLIKTETAKLKWKKWAR